MDIIKKDFGGNAEAEVVLYQPDSSIHIEVLVEGVTAHPGLIATFRLIFDIKFLNTHLKV